MSNRKQGIFIAYKKGCLGYKKAEVISSAFLFFHSAHFDLGKSKSNLSGLLTRITFGKTRIIRWTTQGAWVVLHSWRQTGIQGMH